MSWGKVGAAGIGVVGGMLSGGGQSSSSSSGPWDPAAAKEDLDWLRENAGDRQYYGDQTYADFDPRQTQGFKMTLDAADQIGANNNNLNSAYSNFMSPDFMDPNANPYMSQYVDAALRPIDQRYNEQVMPGIRSNARATGGAEFGSTRQGISEGIATRGYNDTVGDVTAGIYTNLYGKNIDAQQRAMSMSPMVANMMGTPGQMYQGVGAMYQGQDQMGITEDMNRYDYNRDIMYDDTQRNLELNAGTGSQTTTTTPGADPWTTGIGTAMTAYGMMNPAQANDGWDAWDSQYNDDFRDPYELDW